MKIKSELREVVKFLFAFLLSSAFSGVFAVCFLWLLEKSISLRAELPWIVIFLPLVGCLTIWLYRRFNQGAVFGLPLILQEHFSPQQVLPKRFGLMLVSMTFLSHLFGASVGREGVSVQVGAVVADRLRKIFSLESERARRLLLSSGMASGFAALFGTPFAGAVFAVELVRCQISDLTQIGLATIAAFIAFSVSSYLGIHHFPYPILGQLELNLLVFGKLILVGFVLGTIAEIFRLMCSLLSRPTRRHQSIQTAMSYCSCYCLILIFCYFNFGQERFASLGLPMISESFDTNNVSGNMLTNFGPALLKLFTTTLSLAAGFQGGEATPLFAIGASLGKSCGLALDLPVVNAAAFGMAVLFANIIRVPVAGIVIGIEIFGLNQSLNFAVVTLATSASGWCLRPHWFSKMFFSDKAV